MYLIRFTAIKRDKKWQKYSNRKISMQRLMPHCSLIFIHDNLIEGGKMFKETRTFIPSHSIYLTFIHLIYSHKESSTSAQASSYYNEKNYTRTITVPLCFQNLDPISTSNAKKNWSSTKSNHTEEEDTTYTFTENKIFLRP